MNSGESSLFAIVTIYGMRTGNVLNAVMGIVATTMLLYVFHIACLQWFVDTFASKKNTKNMPHGFSKKKKCLFSWTLYLYLVCSSLELDHWDSAGSFLPVQLWQLWSFTPREMICFHHEQPEESCKNCVRWMNAGATRRRALKSCATKYREQNGCPSHAFPVFLPCTNWSWWTQI